MEDLFVPLITFLLIIGSAVFKSMTEENNKETQKPTVTRQTVTRKAQPKADVGDTRYSSSRVSQKSVDEQKLEQLDKLRKDLQISSKTSNNDINKKSIDSEQDLEKLLVSRRKRLAAKDERIGLKNYTKGRGLAGSVVMSEVLGPPRAKKPYRINNR